MPQGPTNLPKPQPSFGAKLFEFAAAVTREEAKRLAAEITTNKMTPGETERKER
jgi:hypothetical protein